ASHPATPPAKAREKPAARAAAVATPPSDPSCQHPIPAAPAPKPIATVTIFGVRLPCANSRTPAGHFTPWPRQGCRKHECRVAARPPVARRGGARFCARGTDRTRPRVGPHRKELLHPARRTL